MFKNNKLITELERNNTRLDAHVAIVKNDLTKIAERVNGLTLRQAELDNPSPYNCGDRVEFGNGIYNIAEVISRPTVDDGRGSLYVEWRFRLTDSNGCLLKKPEYVASVALSPAPLVGLLSSDRDNEEPTRIGELHKLLDKVVEQNSGVIAENKATMKLVEELKVVNESYEARVKELEDQVWILSNPSKHEVGDKVQFCGISVDVSPTIIKKKPCQNSITKEYSWGYLLIDEFKNLMDENDTQVLGVDGGDENYWDERSLCNFKSAVTREKKKKKKILKG